MQKTDLIKRVTARTGKSQRATKQILDAALEVIAETLARGEKVTLTGFGTFEVRQRQEREGVNPQTRAKIMIAATKTPGFSASSMLKNELRGTEGQAARGGHGAILPGEGAGGGGPLGGGSYPAHGAILPGEGAGGGGPLGGGSYPGPSGEGPGGGGRGGGGSYPGPSGEGPGGGGPGGGIPRST